mmetsp:Transcript_51998/g.126893  ORF Transcript_51998/g.126893 Transcript_51998/m.126893 type:complete len:205 (-) Transcript_51998:619-1233(-)
MSETLTGCAPDAPQNFQNLAKFTLTMTWSEQLSDRQPERDKRQNGPQRVEAVLDVHALRRRVGRPETPAGPPPHRHLWAESGRGLARDPPGRLRLERDVLLGPSRLARAHGDGGVALAELPRGARRAHQRTLGECSAWGGRPRGQRARDRRVVGGVEEGRRCHGDGRGRGPERPAAIQGGRRRVVAAGRGQGHLQVPAPARGRC